MFPDTLHQSLGSGPGATRPAPFSGFARLQQGIQWLIRHALLIAVIAQASLLLPKLDLLPYWTDEDFSMRVAPQSLAGIRTALDKDIHPPLYFDILHFWLELPLPGSPIARARALSVVWVILTTVAVDLFWLRRTDASFRGCFLILWTLSPCLLLYGRMARSYSMQMCIGTLAVFSACRLLRAPRSRAWMLAYAGAGTLLLYTHYVPGLAIPAAVLVVAIAMTLRGRQKDVIAAVLTAQVLMSVSYLPWVFSAGKALSRWSLKSGLYMATGNAFLEQGLKLTQWFVTFNFGETFPVGGLWLAALLTPFLLIALWGTWRPLELWMPIAALAAVAGYVGVSRWVTFPFIPARLLFLYPFFLLLLTKALHGAQEQTSRWRRYLLFALVVLWSGGVWAYFGREGFLNKGYSLPIDQMAAVINQEGVVPDELIVLDTCNSDSASMLPLLHNKAAIVYMSGPKSAERIRQAARRSRTIWYWRNTHDICSGLSNVRMETELEADFQTKRYMFVPYSAPERIFIMLMRWPIRPTHFYQLTEMRRKS